MNATRLLTWVSNRRERNILFFPRYILRLTAIIVALVLLPCVTFGDTRSFDIDQFDGVSVAEGIHMFINVGDVFSVSAESDDEDQLDRLVLEVSRGVLRARMDRPRFSFTRTKGWKVTVRVSMPKLTQAESSAGAELVIDEMSDTTLELDASSGSDLRVMTLTSNRVSVNTSGGAQLAVANGTCGTLIANASGGASVGLDGLECINVKVDANTGADANVFASEQINADASTGAAIRVFGAHKKTNINSSSGGSISFP